MPMYTYRCTECGFTSTLHKPMKRRNDPVEHRHADTGLAYPMERGADSGSFHLKGKGFHRNDYGKYGPK
jgi:predicted nucleic acid-binding Zn ribbon protein